MENTIFKCVQKHNRNQIIMNKQIYTKFYVKVNNKKLRIDDTTARDEVCKEFGIDTQKFYRIIRQETLRRKTLLQAIKAVNNKECGEKISKLI